MIPVNRPIIAKKAFNYVTDCLKTGWVSSSGRYVTLFEEKFAKFLGVRYALTTTSGTTALHLALATLRIGPDDEVILPTLTMGACPMSILYTGAKPVLVDSDPETYNLNPEKIEEKITKKTKAVMVVHLYGHPAEMDQILKIAKKYKLIVVEDAAEAHGATYKGKKTGNFGKINAFSFYANKIITTGEGGMVVTNSKKLYERAKALKDLAHSPKKRFLHTELAFNYRLTNLQAALGLAQLEEVKKYLKIKRQMADFYQEKLKNINGLILPKEKRGVKSVYWMYAVLVEKAFPLTKNQLVKKLAENGIETRDFFIPVHQQPAFRKMGLFKDEEYPVAERLSKIGLYLPSGLGNTKAEIKKVCQVILSIVKEKV